MRWRPSRRDGAPRLVQVIRGGGPLLAGAAVVPLEVPRPVPVAGFARLHWMEEGRRDPVAVRALVLREGKVSLALVSAEILLVPGTLQAAVEKRVRDLGLAHVVLAATHTHAGPGAYWDDPLGERLATGPYDPAVFELLADRIATAVRQAAAAVEPAYLSVGRGEEQALARNRAAGQVDGRLVSVRLVARSGKPVAEVAMYPAHATMLSIQNRLLSGDWPGALMRSSSTPVLFFQGALGDQSVRVPPGIRDTPEAYARAVRARLDALDQSLPDPWPELALATSTAVLPPPLPGATPPLLRRITMNVLYNWLPPRARLTVVRLGPLLLVTVPGEPVAAVGARLRVAAGQGAEVLSLAGEYLGYVETSERMAEAAGETVRTLYGPELAERLVAATKLAAEALREQGRLPLP